MHVCAICGAKLDPYTELQVRRTTAYAGPTSWPKVCGIQCLLRQAAVALAEVERLAGRCEGERAVLARRWWRRR